MKRFLFLSLIVILCHSCEKTSSVPANEAPENSYPISTGMVWQTTANSAVVTGYANLKDEYTDSIVGIMYSTDSLVQGDDVMMVSLSMSEVGNNGSFEAELTGLDCNVKYWYRAYLITSDGNTMFGRILSFRTSGLQVRIYTNSASDIYASSAILNGLVNIEGEKADTATLCFLWGRSDSEDVPADTIGTVPASPATSDGHFSAKITGLEYGKSYWYQAICILRDNEYSGKIVSFTVDNENEEVVIALPESTKCEAVDLHLPSGTKWCSFNLGGKSVTDCGDYFAWGDTLPHYSTINGGTVNWKYTPDGYFGYRWETSPYWQNGESLTSVNYSRYNLNDGLLQLQPIDDAATSNMGGNWRMPTVRDWEELLVCCEWFWYESDSSDVKGYVVRDTIENGNSIFLAAGGYFDGENLRSVGSEGYYWSSTGSDTNPAYAYGCKFTSSSRTKDTESYYGYRCHGLLIRPVSSGTGD